VTVHLCAIAVEHDRTHVAVANGAVDGAPDRPRQRDKHDLRTFADDANYAVAVIFAEIVDAGVAGLEHRGRAGRASQPGRSRTGCT
jgi:hypothetical protein